MTSKLFIIVKGVIVLSGRFLKIGWIVTIILITLSTTAWANISDPPLNNTTDTINKTSKLPMTNENDSVSIIITGSANFGTLEANDQLSEPQRIHIDSTSNVPVDVMVKALPWNNNGGNMSLSALKFGNSHTAMATEDQKAIANLGSASAQDVNLYMKVPFGSKAGTYSTTVTWTASAV